MMPAMMALAIKLSPIVMIHVNFQLSENGFPSLPRVSHSKNLRCPNASARNEAIAFTAAKVVRMWETDGQVCVAGSVDSIVHDHGRYIELFVVGAGEIVWFAMVGWMMVWKDRRDQDSTCIKGS